MASSSNNKNVFIKGAHLWSKTYPAILLPHVTASSTDPFRNKIILLAVLYASEICLLLHRENNTDV
jgi:hypothetical protein